MQWLVLTEGLPVGAWRERIGLPSDCELCSIPTKETLQHALKDCPHLTKAWDLFRDTRRAAKLLPAYLSWADISRGLMRDPPGPQIEEELRWDTAAAFSLNADMPWDILRAQLLWSIWCQRVAHTFRDEKFHLGVVLWHAWRNTIYCAMEAYKELFRHKRNEEKRQEAINCFQQIWTAESMFGRMHDSSIKWNITPPQEFLPRELGAWTVPPIRINRLSPSPDLEAEFVARPNFTNLVDQFIRSVNHTWQPRNENETENEDLRSTPHVTNSQQPQHAQGAQGHQEDPPLTPQSVTTVEIESPTVNSRGHPANDTRKVTLEDVEHVILSPERQLSVVNETNVKTKDEKYTFTRHVQDKGNRPRSRVKQRCPKRLNHPSRRHRRENFRLPPSTAQRAEKPCHTISPKENRPRRASPSTATGNEHVSGRNCADNHAFRT